MLQQQAVDEDVTPTHFLQKDALGSVIEESDILNGFEKSAIKKKG